MSDFFQNCLKQNDRWREEIRFDKVHLEYDIEHYDESRPENAPETKTRSCPEECSAHWDIADVGGLQLLEEHRRSRKYKLHNLGFRNPHRVSDTVLSELEHKSIPVTIRISLSRTFDYFASGRLFEEFALSNNCL